MFKYYVMRETYVSIFEIFREFLKNRDWLPRILSTKETNRDKVKRGALRTLLKGLQGLCPTVELSKSALCHVEKECLRRLCELRSSNAFGGVFVQNRTWQPRQRPTAKSWFTKRHSSSFFGWIGKEHTSFSRRILLSAVLYECDEVARKFAL